MTRISHHRLTTTVVVTSALLLSCTTTTLAAAQSADASAMFRLGPGRSGVAATEAELRQDYPADLAPLWTSDGPGTAKGMGAGSPAVSDGRVFVYATDPEDESAYEQIHCLDAASGERLWLATFPGKKSAYGNHCTPAVGAGRVHVGGGQGTLWCLDAKTGEVVWEKASGGPVASSPLLVGDLVVCGNNGTRAYDAASGKLRWEVEGATEVHSPVLWDHGGKAHVLATIGGKGNGQIQCIEAESGSLVWTAEVPDNLKYTTPAVSGDLMAVAGQKQLTVMRLGADGVCVIGQTKDKGGRGAAPVVMGQSVIASTKGGGVRYDVADGELKEVWSNKAPISGGMSSPIMAGGKIFGLAGLNKKKYDKDARTYSYPIYYTQVVVVDAATGEEVGVFGEKLGVIMVSPVIVGGRLYVRGPEGVSCWDLAAQ